MAVLQLVLGGRGEAITINFPHVHPSFLTLENHASSPPNPGNPRAQCDDLPLRPILSMIGNHFLLFFQGIIKSSHNHFISLSLLTSLCKAFTSPCSNSMGIFRMLEFPKVAAGVVQPWNSSSHFCRRIKGMM